MNFDEREAAAAARLCAACEHEANDKGVCVFCGAVGTHVRVVNGAMCGCYGVVIGTVREDGYVILRCRDGILLQPMEFVREGL